ncbi:hypothetical protein FHS70_001856 [Flammeovirga yaeyamensis]|nr:hypothetical protein [Flammeovirga yaeyamensis]
MYIVHKRFGGFRAVSFALNLGGNLIGLKLAIPYDTIHSTLVLQKTRQKHVYIIFNNKEL